MCRCFDRESKIDNAYATELICPSMHAFGRLNWRVSLGHVKPLSSWLHVVAKSLDFYSIMLSAKAADPPNPGTFRAPDACTLKYKNGITAQQSFLDMEGNKHTAGGDKWPMNINGSCFIKAIFLRCTLNGSALHTHTDARTHARTSTHLRRPGHTPQQQAIWVAPCSPDWPALIC